MHTFNNNTRIFFTFLQFQSFEDWSFSAQWSPRPQQPCCSKARKHKNNTKEQKFDEHQKILYLND